MSDDLKLSMSIDGEKLINTINGIHDLIFNFIQKVQTPISLNVDLSNFTDVINASVENVKTTAIDGASQVETAIQSSADQITESVRKNTNGMLTDLSKISLSFQAMAAPIKGLISSFDKFIQASNAQEVSLQNLSSALRLNGELTTANIEHYKSYANEVQRTTNISNDQVFSLLSLATSYGVVESKRKQAVDGAIALSKVYGISLDTALRGVTMGLEGNFEQLQRHIPSLKLAGTEAEKMAQFQKQLADGLQIAKDETETSAGAMMRLKGEVGNLNGLVGELIKDALSPLVKGLSSLAGILNSHPILFKILAGSVITVSVAITSLTTAVSACAIAKKVWAMITPILTGLQNKLAVAIRMVNAALRANPVLAIISGIMALITITIALIAVFRKGKKATEEFNEELENIPAKKEIRFDIKYGDEWTQLKDNLKSRTTTLEDHYQKEMAINEAHYNSNLSQMKIAKRDEKSMLSQKYLEQYAELKKKYKKDEVLLQQHLAEAFRIHQEGLAKINADFLAQTVKLQEEVAEVTRQLDSKYHAEKKSAELSRQKELYDIAKQKYDLELISYDEMKKAMDNYYNWVAVRYNKNSKEYLDAYSIIYNARLKESKDTEKKIEDSTREDFQKAIVFAEKKKHLGIITYSELKKITDDYFEHAQKNYDRDSDLYIEALNMKRNSDLMYAQDMKMRTQTLLMGLNEDVQRNQLGLMGFDDMVKSFDYYLSVLKSSSSEAGDVVVDLKNKLENLLNQEDFDKDIVQNLTIELEEAEKVAGDLEIQIAMVGNQLKSIQDNRSNTLFDWENELHSYENYLDAQVVAFNRNLEKRQEMLRQAGVNEQRITELTEKAKAQFEEQMFAQRTQAAASMFGDMAQLATMFGRDGFKISKALQIAQVTLETPAAAMAAFRAVVGIPVIGPALATAAATTALLTGAMRIKQIANTKPPQYAQGGLLRGASHSAGGIIIEAEGDEYITNKKRVGELGTKFFDFINFAPLEKVKETFSGISLPPIMQTPIPTPVMAMGGSVAQISSKSANMQDMFNGLKSDLVDSLKELKTTFENKKMEVHNHISANDIIKKADPTLVHNANHKGELIISAI